MHYIVTVTRRVHQLANVLVQADSQAEAEEIAKTSDITRDWLYLTEDPSCERAVTEVKNVSSQFTKAAPDITSPQCQKEFPDFAAETLPPIPDGWEDVSRHNNTCPSWVPPGEEPLEVFVNYADENLREIKGGRRFAVLNDDDKAVLETDDWREVRAFVLTAEYHRWLGANPEIPRFSADEAIFHTGADAKGQEQRKWLSDLVRRWDEMEREAQEARAAA